MEIDGAGIVDYPLLLSSSPLPGEKPVLLRNVTIKGGKLGSLINNAGKENQFGPFVKSVDCIQCNIEAGLIISEIAGPAEEIRVQPLNGQPYKITKNGHENIQSFAPAFWGNGTGLTAEYYNGSNFNSFAFKRIDSTISFQEWWDGDVHYKINGMAHSMRWTGQVQSQLSEDHIFHVSIMGGCRLWIEDKLVIDKWNDIYQGSTFQSEPIQMTAGKKYNIRLEYFNVDKYSAVGLYWSSENLPFEYVPQSQLYAIKELISNVTSSITPLAVTIPDVLAVDKGGQPNTIYIGYGPTSLNIAAMPTGGSPAYTYQWSNGANGKSINVNPNTPGEHQFKVTVTDSKGFSKEVIHKIKVIDVRCGNNKVLVYQAENKAGLCVKSSEVASLLATGHYLGNAEGSSPVITKKTTLKISAAPNPSSTKFNLRVNSNSDLPVAVSIISQNGTLIKTYTGVAKNTSINLGQNFSKGTYYVNAQQGDQSETIQLIKI
jgi:hypothetical protein